MTIELRDVLADPSIDAVLKEAFYRKHGFRQPLEADRDLRQIAMTLETLEDRAPVLDRLFERFGAAVDPDLALTNLERYLAAQEDTTGLLKSLSHDQALPSILAHTLGGSPFLARVLIRHPEYLSLLEPDRSEHAKSRQGFLDQAHQAIQSVKGRKARLEALHHYQHRELLRIGYLDLSRIATVDSITRQLSWLADAVVEVVIEEAIAETSTSDSGAFGFSVIGLGKLGGEELNFSSDIDVIYIYSDEAYADSATRLARRVHRYLTDPAAAGIFYRVDLRLRPDGSRGPLASSMQSLETYYESWGETFERLALSKARCIAGTPELGEAFLRLVEPFVYRKYLDYAAIDEVGEIKRRIDQQASSDSELELNVKVGRGGIREIEFFVQALQVLYGGQVPRLRVRSTLVALDRLAETGLIEPEVATDLKGAYRFLRNVEHKLQIVEQRQTHTLPEEPEELERCARRLGISGLALAEGLSVHRATVQSVFRQLFSNSESTEEGESGPVHRFVNGAMEGEELLDWLSSRGLDDARQASEILLSLRDAPAFGHSPSRMKNLLANIVVPLLDAAAESIRPGKVLGGFERLTSAIGAREAFFTSLLESPASIARLARVLDLSESLSDTLIRRPGTVEVLIDRERLPIGGNPLDTESRAMCEFQLGVRYLLGYLTRRRLSRLLSRFAQEELGRQLPPDVPIAVFALGKFGERELNFRSDLDVIVFYEGSYERGCEVLEELVASLGEDYKIDLRLRPEGRKGSLVWDFPSTAAYLEKRAEPWERVAWTKARFVAGNRELATRFVPLIADFVFGRAFSREEITSVKHIRRRMEQELAREDQDVRDLKLGRGGLVDLEFLAQFVQINERIRVPNTAYVLKRAGLPSQLTEAYTFLRDLETAVRLASSLATSRFTSRDVPVLESILGLSDLIGRYRETTDRVREAFDAY